MQVATIHCPKPFQVREEKRNNTEIYRTLLLCCLILIMFLSPTQTPTWYPADKGHLALILCTCTCNIAQVHMCTSSDTLQEAH